MIPEIAERADELKRLCRTYGVQQLDLFGSAATGKYDTETSDLDFLVEFQPEARGGGFSHGYFGLLRALEDLFGRRVDLVVESAITNPYFKISVERSRTRVYEA